MFALVASLIIVLITILVPIHIAGFNNKSSIIATINGNVDDASHLGLLNDRLQFNRGLIYRSDAENIVRSKTAEVYPAGWHSANAIVIKALNNNVTTGIQSLNAYVFTKIFWYFVLIFIFVRTVFTLYKLLSKKDDSQISRNLWLFAGPLILSFYIIDIFREGFYGFLPQLISILLLTLVLIQLNRAKVNAYSFRSSLLLAMIIAVGGSMPWLLALPAVLLSALITLFFKEYNTPKRKILKIVALNIARDLPLYLMIILALIIQYIATTASDTSVSFIKGITLSGGVAMYDNLFYLFVLAGIVLGVLMVKKSRTLIPVLAVIVSILIFSLLVYTLQIIYIGENAYYYYKILYTLIAASLPLAIVGYALLFDWIKNISGKEVSLLITIIFLLVLPQFIIPKSTVSYLRGKREMPYRLLDSLYNDLKDTNTENSYFNNRYILYFTEDKPVQNELGTMLLKSNRPESICFNSVRLSFLENKEFVEHLRVIKSNCSEEYHLNIVTNSESLNDYKNAVVGSGLEKIVSISDK